MFQPNQQGNVMKKASILAAALALSGCASLAPPAPRSVQLTTTFNKEDVAWFEVKGTGTISGQSFFQTRGGQPRTCAGLEVALLPRSNYADERLRAIYGSSDKGYATAAATRIEFTPNDQSYVQTQKTTVCDAQGNFIFSDLPAGSYIITSAVMWSIPGQEYMPPQGGVLMQGVNLAEGETKRVILTP